MAHANPLRAVTQLQEAVHSLAPVLRPQILPKGASYGVDLVIGLCKTAEQKQELRALIQSTKPATQKEDNDGDEDELEAQVVGAFDAEKRVFNIEKLVWMKQQDAVIHEFARFLELQLDSPKEALQIVAHFLEVNGHALDNTLAAEQCFNAAFALQTIVRAFPRPPFAIDGVSVEIDEDTNVAKVFAPLFGAKKAAAKANKKASKSRSKKRKST